MAYIFNEQEIQRLQEARLLSPGDDAKATSEGDWSAFYTELSSVLRGRIVSGTVQGNDLQELINAKLWTDVAIGANSGEGVHSDFIRTYTNRQGELRLGNSFSDAEMQFASNGVALNLWNNLKDGSNGKAPWTAPTIAEIAQADASSIGTNLFGSDALGSGLPDNLDTAISRNSGWSGALGFNLLGGNQPFETWRLITAGDDPANPQLSTVNKVDDFKNLLYV